MIIVTIFGMEKKYIIVRLDDNNYWGRGFWVDNISDAQLFEDIVWPTQRVKERDLIDSNWNFEGNFFEVREIWVKK